MLRKTSFGVTVLTSALALSGTAGAATSLPGTLGTGGGQVLKVTWTGTLKNPLVVFPVGPAISQLCAVYPAGSCQQFTLAIGDATGKEVAVAVGWTTEAQQIDLYVNRPDGSLAASSAGIGSRGQSIVLASPSPGTYTIVLAGARVIGEEPFSGLAQVQDPVPVSPATSAFDLLPRLITPPPDEFHVNGLPIIPSTPLGFVVPTELLPFTLDQSCYIDEVGNPLAHRCLRFTNDVVNVGGGPLELEFRAAPNAGLCEVRQVIHRSDGSKRRMTLGAACEFHDTHVHFHFNGLARFELHDPQGNLVATGRKVGFCLGDIDPESARNLSGRFGPGVIQPIRSRAYRFPNCNLPVQVTNGLKVNEGLWNVMGITQGWGDVYTWDLPDQYIEVTDVPAGKYQVVSIADPPDTDHPDGFLLRESSNDLADRTGQQWICLTSADVTPIAANESCP